MDIKQGLFRIDPNTYHNLPIISYTGVKEFQKSPAHYKAMLDGEKHETPQMVFGGAYHCWILEKDIWDSQYIVRPWDLNPRSKDGVAWIEAAERSGKTVITEADMCRIMEMAKVIHAHPQWKIFSPKSEREIAMVWEDKKHGVWCRTRIDLLQPNMSLAVDLKTTVDASPRPFLSAAFRLGYHIQAAWTIRGLSEITSKKHDSFVFIAQEKNPPYAVNVFEAQEEFIRAGNEVIDSVLPAYKVCLDTDTWPGYSPEVKPLLTPTWWEEGMEGVKDGE